MTFSELMGSTNNKLVLITGAAFGLGRALTLKFLAEGWRVIATDKVGSALADLKGNPEVLTCQMDVTSDVEVRSTINQIKSKNIQLDLIINNAGIDRYFPLSEAPVENFKEIFEVNLFGAYRVNQTFLPILKKPGGGIIHIGSESLNLAIPFMPYPITKNAMEKYAKVLRQELKFHGIDVVVVRPGAIRTGLLENVLKLKSAVISEAKQGPEFTQWSQLEVQMEKFAELAPKNIGKVLDPEVVAAFVYKVSKKANPAAVYTINNSLQLKIIALLPFSLVEKLVRKRLSV
jgi:NAD(P)-dependent dehydrogenase (short-subunit alcohol dehydrogenase family)